MVADALSSPPGDGRGLENVLAVSGERDAWEHRLLAAAQAAYRAGYADGRADERAGADRAWAAQVADPVRDGPALAEVEARRWHVCCRRCRLSGHRLGCEDCEDRVRETFGRLHRDDHNAQGRRAA
jgi:hypothetical protein